MRFELNDELINEILFFMENQNGSSKLDTQKGIVIDLENNFNDEDDENNFSDNDDKSDDDDIDEFSSSDDESDDDDEKIVYNKSTVDTTINDKDRFIDLHEWDSSDGFREM